MFVHLKLVQNPTLGQTVKMQVYSSFCTGVLLFQMPFKLTLNSEKVADKMFVQTWCFLSEIDFSSAQIVGA